MPPAGIWLSSLCFAQHFFNFGAALGGNYIRPGLAYPALRATGLPVGAACNGLANHALGVDDQGNVGRGCNKCSTLVSIKTRKSLAFRLFVVAQGSLSLLGVGDCFGGAVLV